MKIPIKIQNNSQLAGQEIKKRPELPKKPGKKISQYRLIFFIIILLLLILLLLVARKPASPWPFLEIIPADTSSFVLLNIDDLWLKQNPLAPQLFFSQAPDFLKKINLNFEQDIKPLYQEKIAFLMAPEQDRLDFLVLLQRKNNQTEQGAKILAVIEKELKKDFNFSENSYRQLKITTLKPVFNSDPNNYFYCQTQNYFIISNSLPWLEKILDRIIE